MKKELLNHCTPKDITDAERVLNDWRTCNNTERPHEALGMRCPSDVYCSSDRTYHDEVKPYNSAMTKSL